MSARRGARARLCGERMDGGRDEQVSEERRRREEPSDWEKVFSMAPAGSRSAESHNRVAPLARRAFGRARRLKLRVPQGCCDFALLSRHREPAPSPEHLRSS